MEQNPLKERLSIEEEIKQVLKDVDVATEQFIKYTIKNTEYYRSLIVDGSNVVEHLTLELISRERAFAREVLKSAYALCERHEERIALFDVDDTLAKTRVEFLADGKTKYNTFVRPAALPVLQKLIELGFINGLITTRGPRQKLIEEALEDEKNLFGIKKVIDRRHVYTTSDIELEMDITSIGGRVSGADANRVFDFFRQNEIVISELTEYDREDMTTSGNFKKLMILAGIKKRKGQKIGILVVDDIQYPRFLNEQHGLYGVALSHNKDIGGTFSIDKRFIPV